MKLNNKVLMKGKAELDNKTSDMAKVDEKTAETGETKIYEESSDKSRVMINNKAPEKGKSKMGGKASKKAPAKMNNKTSATRNAKVNNKMLENGSNEVDDEKDNVKIRQKTCKLNETPDELRAVANDNAKRPFKRKLEYQTKASNKRLKQGTKRSPLNVCKQDAIGSAQKTKARKTGVYCKVFDSQNATNFHRTGCFSSLQCLEEECGHDQPIKDLFSEPRPEGRQTCASRGLQYLFLSNSHPGGIWQAIYSEV